MFVLGTSQVRTSSTDQPSALTVLWREGGLIALSKPGGMPAQPDRTSDRDALSIVRSMHPGEEVGLIHRLDRPVSGVLLMTLDPILLPPMNTLFREGSVRKTYLAVVEGETPAELVLEHRLTHNPRSRKASADATGRIAQLRATRLAQGDRYALLFVEPASGRFHQIRAQLAAAGNPIKGDVKYGARRGERDRSISLHAYSLGFQHPRTRNRIEVKAPPPSTPLWAALIALASGRLEPDRAMEGGIP